MSELQPYLDKNTGIAKVREHEFKLRDIVSNTQFKILKDKIKQMDDADGATLSESQLEDLEDEWFKLVCETALQDVNYADLESKLSRGEIRTLVRELYGFLYQFGSISEAKRFMILSREMPGTDKK